MPGSELLLNDGRLRLMVEQCGPDFAVTRAAIVAINGMPFGTPGTTNLMRIATV